MSGEHPLEVRYEWLDRLPASLFQPVVTHVHGQLAARGKAILTLREALLSGRVPAPEELAWPDEALRRTLLEALIAANVAPYCSGDPEITDDMLLFILQTVGDAQEMFDRALVAFHVLARKDEKQGACDESGGSCDGGPGGRRGTLALDEAALEEARRDAARLICELVQARTKVRWSELVAISAELARIFEELAAALRLPPGLARGMLRSLPRADLLEMRRLLDYLPALDRLVAALGRMQETRDPDADSVLERIGRAVVRSVEREREVRSDHGAEVRGIERSGEVARMLPSEAALLTHPTLRLLWRARWAEHALLTYRAEGVFTKRIQEQQTFEDGEARRALRAERGPVLIVFDTSGSMCGLAERVAKAIVVQIVGAAFLQKRRCYLYNFSGRGDVEEAELSLDGDGLARVLAFVGASFHGGTDIDEPIRRACQRIQSSDYRQADIAVISDGNFFVGRHIDALLRATKQKSAVRVHGIRVGAGGGFADLSCDTTHEVSSWTGYVSEGD